MLEEKSTADQSIMKLNQRWSKPRACLDYIHNLSWSPNGHFIACADATGYVSIHSSITGHLNQHWPAHHFGALRVGWSHNGKFLASAGQDGKAHIYESTGYKTISTIVHEAAWVEHIAWHKHQDLLLSAAGRQLKLNEAGGKLLEQFEEHPSTIADIAWHPVAANTFATTSYGGARVWTTSQPKCNRTLSWKGALLNLAYSPNGKVLASGCLDGAAHIWLLPSGDDLFMNGYPTKVRELTWDSTSRYLATGGGPKAVVWDFSGNGPEGKKPLMFSGHQSYISTLAFEPKGLRLASGGLDGKVNIWDLSKQHAVLTHTADAEVTGLAWSPNSNYLAASFASGGLTVFDTQ